MNRLSTRMRRLSLAATILLLSTSMLGREARAEPAATPAAAPDEDLFAALTGKPGGLTSDTVAARARKGSPALAGKRAEVERAARELDRTIVDLFPRLSFTGKYTRMSSTGSTELGPFVVASGVSEGPVPPGTPLAVTSIPIESIDNQFSFTASLSIPISDYAVRLPQSTRAARAAARAAELDVEASARDVELEARVLYYNWVKAELATAVAEQSLRLAVAQHDRIAKLSAAGASTGADEASARALVAKSKMLLERSGNLATQLRGASRQMHDETSAPSDYRIGEDLASLTSPPPPSQKTLTAQALGARAEIRAANARVAGLSAQAEATRSLLYPRLDAAGAVGAVNPGQRRFPSTAEFHSTWQVGVTLSFSPNDAALGGVSGAAADARTRAAVAQAAAIEDGIRKEVIEARTAWRDAQAAIEASEREEEAAQLAYENRFELFVHDRATPVELEQAHDDLLRARLDVVDARIAAKIAQARLAHATGARGRRSP